MAAVTSITKRRLELGQQYAWIYFYTKAGATDTLDCASEFGQVDKVDASSSVGTQDAATVSGTTVTLSTGTGAGSAIVYGDAL